MRLRVGPVPSAESGVNLSLCLQTQPLVIAVYFKKPLCFQTIGVMGKLHLANAVRHRKGFLESPSFVSLFGSLKAVQTWN